MNETAHLLAPSKDLPSPPQSGKSYSILRIQRARTSSHMPLLEKLRRRRQRDLSGAAGTASSVACHRRLRRLLAPPQWGLGITSSSLVSRVPLGHLSACLFQSQLLSSIDAQPNPFTASGLVTPSQAGSANTNHPVRRKERSRLHSERLLFSGSAPTLLMGKPPG